MLNVKLFIKKYKFNILIFLFIEAILLNGTYEYYHNYFNKNNLDFYDHLVECNKDNTLEFCSEFEGEDTEKLLDNVINVRERLEKLDAITLASASVEEPSKFINILSYLFCIFIAIMVTYLNYGELKTSVIKFYLLREDYKSYIWKKIKEIFMSALVMPLAMIFLFLVCCVITKFNFIPHNDIKELALYFDFKYNHFLLYGSLLLLYQFLLGCIYGLITLNCNFKNKSGIMSVIMSFLYCNIIIIVDYILANKLFYKISNGYIYNFANFTNFFDDTKYIPLFINVFVVLGIVSFIIYRKFRTKESVVICNEEKIS